MAISQGVRKAIHKRAGGQCECIMKVCGHSGRCTRGLSPGYWDAHHRTAGGPDIPSNLIAMCATCHKNTRTYGRS
ncbi:MAG: HNH endonuclease [Candidatus Dadabacteria bacterium]|nr:HNH endonuclease [Candidatus Dadabacteria bacterium]